MVKFLRFSTFKFCLLIVTLINQYINCVPLNEDEGLYDLPVYDFTVPKHDPENACIKLKTSFFITVNYQAKFKDEEFINQVNITPNDIIHTGTCQKERNQIQFMFLDNWRLEFYFYKTNDSYLFNHVVLYYQLDSALFPNSTTHGARSEVYDNIYINSSLSKSYRCYSGLKIDLGDGEIIINLFNFKIEAFFNKRPNLPFDEEVLCPNDIVPQPSVLDSVKWWLYAVAIFSGILILASTCFVCCVHKEKKKEKSRDSDPFENVTNNKNRDGYEEVNTSQDDVDEEEISNDVHSIINSDENVHKVKLPTVMRV